MAATTIRVWVMPRAGPATIPTLNEYLEPILAQMPGVSVEWRVLPWNRAVRDLIAAFKKGNPPDVFELGNTWVASMAHLGYLAPVPDGVQERPAVAPWIDESVTIDEETVAVPWTVACEMVEARLDLLEAAGVEPESLGDWPGFLEAVRRVAEQADRMAAEGTAADSEPIIPLALAPRPDVDTLHRVSSWLWSGGWEIRFASPARILTAPSARPGLDYLKELCQVSPSLRAAAESHRYRQFPDFYQEGRFAFLLGSWVPTVLRLFGTFLQGMEVRWPTLPITVPRGPAGPAPRAGGTVLAVSPDTQEAEAAWTLVKHLNSEAFHEKWVRWTGLLPGHKYGLWEEAQAHEFGEAVWQTVASARLYPVHPLWQSMEAIMGQGLSETLWMFLRRESEERIQGHLEEVDERLTGVIDLGWEVARDEAVDSE